MLQYEKWLPKVEISKIIVEKKLVEVISGIRRTIIK